MNYKTTLALLFILALIGVYFYFFEYDQISGYEARQQLQQQRAESDPGTAAFNDETLSAEAIDRIDITRNERTYTLVKEDGDWLQTQPVRFPIEAYAVEPVAENVARLRYLQRYAKGSADAPSLEQMGLDEPRAVVTVYVGDKTWTLKLGKVSMGGRGYVAIEGDDHAYVVNATLHGTVLDQDINDWRKKSINAPKSAGVERIELLQTEGKITLNKVDGRWLLEADGVQRASDERVDELVSAVGRLWITQFSEDNPQTLRLYGLNSPHMRVTLQTPPADADTTATTQTLTIGGTSLNGSERYATWTRNDEPANVVFTLNAANAEGLSRSADQLRDPRVFVAQPQDFRGLSIEQNGETTLDLVRDPQAGFRFGEPDPGYGVDYSTANSFIDKLCTLNAERFTTDLDSLGGPIATGSLSLATGNGKTPFSIYESGDDRVIVTEGETVGYVVAKDKLPVILDGPLALRKRTLIELPADKIATVKLARPDGVTYQFKRTTVVQDQQPGWELADHETFEQDTLQSLLAALYPLRVETWLPTDTAIGETSIELTIDPVEGDTSVLLITADGRHGKLKGKNGVFTLPESFASLLTTEYRERTVLPLTAELIRSVTVAGQGKKITIKRDGQHFVTGDDEFIEPDIAAGVFDTLAGLRAQRYVTHQTLLQEQIDTTIEITTTDAHTYTLRLHDATTATTDITETVTLASMNAPEDAPHKAWFTLLSTDADSLRAALNAGGVTPTK